ncbi:tetratricopeptide repeat protein [Streptomyces boncukensis]|uniref:Tetratricopeptide repeat protein n=1 Tax=Streptomyces boncukensis TaxID=2711219 RepID=A0A6G4X5W3_9ACTN|nr:tetratricopeptide repeat protein [Streptomyces boncukensis]NGO72926.1 tetratricopeptide repeat protein [Streptomyces boncukensis]
MASSPSTSPGPHHRPNSAFRALRGLLSPGEFAAAVRRSAREIGEQVSCDARYIGRVEAGEIRCPNYAYERVFLHMFPGYSLADMGFAPRETVRGRSARIRGAHAASGALPEYPTRRTEPLPPPDRPSATEEFDSPGEPGLPGCPEPAGPADHNSNASPSSHRSHSSHPGQRCSTDTENHHEESDVLRRAFMTGGPAALAAASLGGALTAAPAHAAAPVPAARQAGNGASEADARTVERAVRRIRVLDDRHGADGLYRRAGEALRAAYDLLDVGSRRQSIADRLHSGAGELAISVGWLAHDSARYHDARSHYAEALATARVAGDAALEAHAFCNSAFLARDAGRPREAVRAAQAGQRAARRLGSHHLLSLLTLREAGGWAGLGDRPACQQALGRAQRLFARGSTDADPEWMTFFGEAELEGLEAQCWSALGDWRRATDHAQRAVDLQDPHFTRNRALFTAELAGDLAAQGHAEAAAAAGGRALDFLGPVQSTRITTMLDTAAGRLRPYRREPPVADFLARHAATATA